VSPTSGDGGPREGLRGKRSEGRLRTPLRWQRQPGLSSLWKTLRSVALQGRALIDANTGVLGERQGGARNGKWAGSQCHAWNCRASQAAHPPAPAACPCHPLAGRQASRSPEAESQTRPPPCIQGRRAAEWSVPRGLPPQSQGLLRMGVFQP